MTQRKQLFVVLAMAGLTTLLLAAAAPQAQGLTLKQKLGQFIFFDKSLSQPSGQSCAACHARAVGWTGPSLGVNLTGGVYPGAVHTRFGNRKPPASAYAGKSPTLHFDSVAGTWVGGMFWDGRATGDRLGDPLAEQAQGPFLNPLEQNNLDAATVIAKIKKAPYAALFRAVWGTNAFGDTVKAYDDVGFSIAAFERSRAMSAFTSKYDAYLAHKVSLRANEKRGLDLFTGKAGCSGCHVPPRFTDYTYDNIGIPKNPLNPFYTEPEFNPMGADWVDYGLGAYLESTGAEASVYEPQMGKFKVPTLRNVAKKPFAGFVKAYGHNGYFKSLWAVVHFYNTRDVLPWPAPEVSQNLNTTELGNLGLTLPEEKDIVAFLKTLSDGFGMR